MKLISYGIIAAAASALIGLAGAQSMDEITVQATRNMGVKIDTQTPPGGAQVKDISLSYVVSSSGLNLALHADVLELQKRVKDAALTACKEIGRQYPNSMPNDADCAKAASDKAMTKVNTIVAAAGKKSS
jgi:UrcA family protein